jgi:ATP-binding cassette subfamily C (CFTR/MRP) protein 1
MVLVRADRSVCICVVGDANRGTDVEINSVSVDRMKWVADLPPESKRSDAMNRPLTPPDLIKEGRLTFRNVELRYAPDAPLALKGLTFNIEPGMKVGICGRTGSGKSSTLGALFRMVDIEPTGSIQVDGQDVSALDLYDLRSSMSIVPQDPASFAISLRENLDPEGQATDADIWAALDRTHVRLFHFPSLSI